MSIKNYYFKVQETSTTLGTIGLTLDGASTSYQTFNDTVGTNKDFTYSIINSDNTLEWEYGIGHLENVLGNYILSRDQILASSAGIALVSFGSGTKTIDLVQTNNSIINLAPISGTTSIDYVSASYIVDASAGNLSINLPSISDGFDNVANEQSVLLSFVLNNTSGSLTEQIDAVTIIPSGADTIGGSGDYKLSIKNDFIQILSNPTSNDWVLLDPIQDSIYPSGGDGAIQFAENQGFSYSSGLYWDINNGALVVGSTGVASGTVVISQDSTTIFNNTSGNIDFIINGNGTQLLTIDASANNIGIKETSPSKLLDISVSGSDGIRVKTDQSSSIPQLIFSNTYTGLSAGDDIGHIIFNSVDDASNSTDYAKIFVEFISDIDGSEEGVIKLQINKDGSLQTVAEYAYSGIVLGHDNANVNGIVIGEQNTNFGDNIVIGYYSSGNAVNSIMIGDNNVISSGSFGGIIGKNHAVSGTNTWVLGGSGISVTGDNSTYVVLDSNNFLAIQNSGLLNYHGLNTSGIIFQLTNEEVLTSGNIDSLKFNYFNSAGQELTGLQINNRVYVPTSGSEESALEVYCSQSGVSTKIIDIRQDYLFVGNSSSTSGNIIYANNSTITNTGNVIFGDSIVVSGNNTINIGINNVVNSGVDNITVIGKSNTVDTSGNNNITVIGLSNNVDEDYSTTIGINNTNSGLYSSILGFDNGANGSYISVVGESNTVTVDASLAFGNNNTINDSGINAQGIAIGVGNTITASGTGISVGFDNSIYGNNASIFGLNNYSSGLNNIICGNNNTLNGSGLVVVGNSITYSGIDSLYIANTGSSLELTTDQIKLSGDIYINNTGISEYIQDVVGNSITGTGSVSVSYDDLNDSIIISGQTIYDETINIVGVSGLSGSGSFTLNQSSGVSIQLQHDDTSSVSNSGLTNTSGNVIQSINLEFDNYGHTTGITIASTDLDARYALTSHSHSSSNITDFNSAVSGLLPVKDVIAGSGIDVVSSTGNYTVSVDPSNLLPHIFASGGANLVDSTGTFSISNTLTVGSIIPQTLTFKFGAPVTDLNIVVSGLNTTIDIDSILGGGPTFYNYRLTEGSVVTSGSPSSFDIEISYSGSGGEVTTTVDLYMIGIKV